MRDEYRVRVENGKFVLVRKGSHNYTREFSSADAARNWAELTLWSKYTDLAEVEETPREEEVWRNIHDAEFLVDYLKMHTISTLGGDEPVTGT